MRNCGWTEQAGDRSSRIVWKHKQVTSTECPKSAISPRSLQFLEQYVVWKQFGGINVLDLDVKTADAFSVLERAWQEETRNGEVEK